MPIAFHINGQGVSSDAPPQTPLLWVIREDIKLTGTKFGCGAGLCGACMVHIDGKRAFSCQTQLADVGSELRDHYGEPPSSVRNLLDYAALKLLSQRVGAVQIERDTKDAIAAGVRELCRALVEQNALAPDEIVSAFFTLTPDLHAEFPAKIARDEGWDAVPMICAQELDVPNALPRVCRVMLHVDRDRRSAKAKHVYLGGARKLRPDLGGAPST